MFVSLLYLTFLLVLGVSPYLLCEKSHLNTLVTLGGTDLASWNLSINGSAFEIPFIADFHAEILVDDENRLYENWKFLVKNDNIEVLVRVLNQLEDKIRKGDFGHTEKMLISCVATVVTQASQSLALAEEMFRQGLVAQLIKTVFHFEFLNDTNLSSDLLVSGLNLIRNSFRKEISFEVKQKLEQLLEPFWPAINNLFHAESSPLVKLMIGNLMVRKKELLPNILTIQKTELLSLRDSIFPSSSDQQDAFHHSMKTKFFGFETVMVDRGEVQNLFNTFLASEENRKVLCNRRTFEDFFLAVNKIAANAKADAGKIKRLQKWATASLRGLYVEIITCVAFRPFFQDFHVKSELYFRSQLH